ncbi:MAG: glycosyltransferase family 39 protein [Clostridiales bacterium]|nr:glycosyltransferase family 39 protein [Clostridiales bacterium]
MELLSANGATTSDIIVIVFLVLLTIGCIAALPYFLCKNIDNDKPVVHKKTALLIILAVGLVIRLAFSLSIRGYREDYNVILSMFDDLSKYGVGKYYTGNFVHCLYPIAYVVYLLFGGISNLTGLTTFSSLSAQFMVKLPLIISDLLAAFAVYKIAKKYFNERVAYVLCAFVCLCPIFFMGSVVWTTPATFTAMFACFALYCLVKKNYAAMIGFATASAFSSKEGIYLFPVFAVFSVFHLVRAVFNLRASKKSGASSADYKALLKGECNAVISVPLGFVGSLLVVYLLGLTMFASYSYNPFTFINEFLLLPLVTFDFFTYNGLSIYAVFNLNGSVPNTRFPAILFAVLFALIITAIVSVVYFTKRNRATLVMLAAYSMFTLSVYYPGATPVTLTAALVLTLVAYALVKDKRLLTILFVAGLAYVINTSSILACAGFLGNAENFSISATTFFMDGNLATVPIACSAVTVLAHLYFTLTTVSIGTTGNKKMLRPCGGFGASVKEFFARKVD